MPSPVGHSLIGLAAANLPLRQRLYTSLSWLGFVVFVANAPDLDFLPGLVAGDINRYHHGLSHSIGVAVLFAAACGTAARVMQRPWRRVFFVALVVYSSHLLGDYLAVDRVEPFGAPFLWPLSDEYYLSPVQLFRPVEHGSPGEANLSVIDKIFSRENLVAAGVEALIVLPLWLLTAWIGRRQPSCGS